MSLVHSKACMPTNVAPNAAVHSNRMKVIFLFFSSPNLTAIAMVPLLLIRTKVMMAIRRRGMLLPNSVRPKTSLGLGQGSVVDIRTVMYEIKKELNMKVSLRRKIHIMALPQGTFLNARWSEDQSATMPGMPSGSGRACPVFVRIACVMFLLTCSLDPTELQQNIQIIP